MRLLSTPIAIGCVGWLTQRGVISTGSLSTNARTSSKERLPEPIAYKSNREYVRQVLREEVDLRADGAQFVNKNQEPERSRDHTERMLAARGVGITSAGTAVSLHAARAIEAVDVVVPGDPSSAAFFAALAAIADTGSLSMPGVGINPTRTGFFDALARMGASLQWTDSADAGGEPIGTLHASASTLRGIAVGAAEVPSMIDELPLLACIAACAQGDTEIRGAAELRVKESDRIAAVVANLRAIGADAEELPDGMRIAGSGRPLRGRVVTHGDHRLAMAFGILGARAGNDIVIDDPACVGVSYPAFWDDLRRVVAR